MVNYWVSVDSVTKVLPASVLTALAASTTAAGISELATSAETITGTDAARVVTPAGLQAKVASETVKGLVELATNAETVTGTDTTRATHPAGVAAAIAAAGGGPLFADPNADRIAFWDDSAGAFVALVHSAPVNITGTSLTIDAATTTASGIVELATSAETITGTDTTRAVTAAGLQAKVASETVLGLQEFATAAESVTGSSNALSVHPAGLLATRGLYVGVNAQTGTTYAPVLADQGKLVTCANGSAITVTMPSNATTAFPIGTQIDFAVLGAGMVTFVAGGGATVNGTPSLVTRATYSAVTLIKAGTDYWLAVGDLA